MKAVLIFLCVFLGGCATEVSAPGMARCDAEGGCATVTRRQFEAVMDEMAMVYYMQGMADALAVPCTQDRYK